MKKRPRCLFAYLLLSAIFFQSLDCLAQKEFKGYSVRGTMYVNGDYTRRPFPKLLIFTSLFDKKINKKILDEFEKIQLNAINSLNVLPPVKDYTQEELMTFYREYDFDYVITTEVKDRIADEGVLTQQIQVTLFDVEKNNKAVIFVGRALSTTSDQDRAIHKFFRAAVKELAPIIVP